MIKVNEGEVIVSGARLDLIFDFNALLKAMAIHEPKITAISIAEQGDTIGERFLESPIANNGEALGTLELLIKSAIESLKDGQL